MSETTVKWYELTKARRFELETDSDHVIKIEREVIPVIFVPGIMGTRLAHNGDLRWDPGPNSTTASFASSGAQGRKEMMVGTGTHDPNYLTVDLSSAAELPGSPAQQQERFERRWGGLLASSYMEFMEALDTFLTSGALIDTYGRYFEFPLHGGGYNWTADNDISGEKLAEYITELKDEYTGDGTFCEKVILITHSMGGLVSRSAICLHGAESDVLGVVHGVQPVTGGPAAYKRVRAGFGSIFSSPANRVLGNYGEFVTPIFANAPGALELLPTKRHEDNGGRSDWLRIESGTTEVLTRPIAGDPYEEIYRQRTCFWRLVDESLVLPGSSGGSRGSPGWTTYSDNLDDAESFHDRLGHAKHPNSYEIYGTSSGGNLPTFDNVVMRLEIDYTWPYTNAPLTDQMVEDIQSDPTGYVQASGQEMTTSVVCTFALGGESINCTFDEPTGSGDETVPAASGRALTGTKGQRSVSNVGHEPAYRNATVQRHTTNALQIMINEHFNDRIASA